MASWRARSVAATLSVLLHALLIWVISGWDVTQPGSLEAPVERVVVSLAPPQPAPAQPPPPAPAPALPEAESEPIAEVAPPSEVEPPPPPQEAAPPEPAPEAAIPLPERQIVSMPDAGEEKPPPETRFLSDRDNVVKEEMVRQGEPAPSSDLDGDDVVASAPDAPAEPPASDRAALEDLGPGRGPDIVTDADSGADRLAGRADRPVPDLASLMPNALALAAQQARNAPQEKPGGAPPQRSDRQRSAAAWEPTGALRGTLDHLPDVQPGNVTLLNTKAEMFAPFVRRVMLRVFQNLMILMRRNAPSMRPGVNEQIEAEAIMSPTGEMIDLRITRRSTSMSIGLDRMLTEACNEAFFDRNPPPGAVAADGNIHFVLQTIVQTYSTPGGGVALSGLFGVGLL